MGNIAQGACQEGYSMRRSRILYWPSRYAPSALYPVMHQHNWCFNWFIVLWFPPTNACAFLTATIANPAVMHSCVIFLNIHQSNHSRLAAPMLQNKNSTGGWSASSLASSWTTATYLYDQICSMGFLPHLLRMKVVCPYCQACSCWIQVTRRSSLPHAAVSIVSSVVWAVPKIGGPTSFPKQTAFNAVYVV